MLIGGFGSRQLTPSMLLVPWILLEAEDHPWKWEMFRFPWGESLTLPCQAPHFSSGDKVKVPFSLWIEKCHRFHSIVIRSYPASGNLKMSTTNSWKTWRGWFPVVEVQEPFRALSPHVLAHTSPRQPAHVVFNQSSSWWKYHLIRMRHPRRVPSHNVEIGARSHPSPGMPLNLSWICRISWSILTPASPRLALHTSLDWGRWRWP